MDLTPVIIVVFVIIAATILHDSATKQTHHQIKEAIACQANTPTSQ